MKIKKYKAKVFEQDCVLELMDFNKRDGNKWKRLFDMWKKLKLGMREYKSREPNFPEGLSEVAFCIFSKSKRFISLPRGGINSSFDTFNLNTGRAEQIKACSVGSDLTSFGPNSRWDDLYFLDFYNKGKLDGTFNVYKIPSDLIYSMKVNKDQTMKEQQADGKRPRFSITDKIIVKHKINPIAENVKIW
jgi:hypothetical protein